MKERILITGGLGFIGSKLTTFFLERGYGVTVLDNLSPQIHGNNGEDNLTAYTKYPGFNFIKGDVRNELDCINALKGADYVIHLAAETGTGQSMYEITRYVDVNVKGTAVLINEIFRNSFPVKRVILSSSRSVYGEGKYECKQHGVVYPATRYDSDLKSGKFEPICSKCGYDLFVLPTDEESIINPLSVYATTKYQQEQLVHHVYNVGGIPYTIFRYQNVYGPGQSLNNPYTGILSIFSTRIRNGNGLEIFEDGIESRDFVYIDDVVAATALPVLHPSGRNEVINVGTGKAISVNEVVEGMISFYKANISVNISGKYRIGDIRHNKAEIKKLNELYNFFPATAFKEGLTNFLNWVNTQPVPEDKYEISIKELKERNLYK